MQIEVNLDNIVKYELDKLTGNCRADLLAAAARAGETEYILNVEVPVEWVAKYGGPTEPDPTTETTNDSTYGGPV
jgi:hypothetical protein